jgi:hypothetical protein
MERQTWNGKRAGRLEIPELSALAQRDEVANVDRGHALGERGLARRDVEPVGKVVGVAFSDVVVPEQHLERVVEHTPFVARRQKCAEVFHARRPVTREDDQVRGRMKVEGCVHLFSRSEVPESRNDPPRRVGTVSSRPTAAFVHGACRNHRWGAHFTRCCGPALGRRRGNPRKSERKARNRGVLTTSIVRATRRHTCVQTALMVHATFGECAAGVKVRMRATREGAVSSSNSGLHQDKKGTPDAPGGGRESAKRAPRI